ncbi:PQQ-binding-like beta-propeller repeat protein [Streptomyces sp. NPDC005963]|uniref:outer membrane protein assembly factor BamB family protein n=1 Tax=Streptomyces sp. NPDC005963 TaxID=3156721 RepID=UPI0033F11E8B
MRSERSTALRPTVAIAVCLGLLGGLWALWPGDDDDRRQKASTRDSSTRPTMPASPSSPSTPAVAWQVPATGDGYAEGPGAWGLGDVVVQGRIDGLFAYRAGDGAVHWTRPAPARQAVCAMSRSAQQGIGIIAYGRHDKPCSTLVAVRTSDGKELWQRTLADDGLVELTLAVGGSTLVTAEDGALRARSTTTGTQQWQRVPPRSCEARAVGATAARTLLVEQCGKGARLIALDTRTGKEQWGRPLPVESEVGAAVISVAPVVVAVTEDDQRGTQALLSFDDRGAPVARVPMSGPAGHLVLPAGAGPAIGNSGHPVVLGDLVITLAERDMWPDVVVAHSLKDGRKAWEYRAGGTSMYGVAREPDGRIGVLIGGGNSAHVVLLDATGRVKDRIAPDNGTGALLSISPELIPVTGGHVVVNHQSTRGEPGIFAIR